MDYFQQLRNSFIQLFCINNKMNKSKTESDIKRSRTLLDLYITEDEELLRVVCPEVKENEQLKIKKRKKSDGNIEDKTFKWKCDKCGRSLEKTTTYMYKDHKFCSFTCRNSFEFSDFYGNYR